MPATVPAGAPPAAEAQGPVLGPERFEPLAGLLAILLPGAGHVVLGERRRGVLIGAGVLGLFLGGMLIGGIDAIDRKEDPIWFIGQAMVGPVAFGVDYYHQEFCKIREPANIQSVHAKERYSYRSALPTEARDPSGLPAVNAPGARPPNSKSLGRMNELGTLFATIAGMLNLIVIIDAFYHARAVAPRPGAAA
ncbi:MAG: DUF6677 family protein [Phycisphaerales bacterium]